MFRPALLALACALSVAAHAYAADPRRLDIPAGDLTAALETLARQSGVELVYQSDELRGLRTQGVTGNLTPEEAVTKLLQDTPLTFRKDASGAMLVALPRTSSSSEAVPGSNSSRTPSAPQAFNNPEAPDLGTTTKSGFWDRFRLAQNEPSSQSDTFPSNEQDPSQSSDKKSESRVIEEVVVTGSHIRGVQNPSSPLLVFDREYIEKSGFGNTQQLFASLPQNFAGGGSSSASEDGIFSGGIFNASNEESRATGVNLRGLGAVATLTLLNGRRIAPSADGQFVDVSAIPISAIERVDVLLDGASAIYGADAVAGVVNIILRRNFDGAETTLRYGSGTHGDLHERRASQSFGRSWASGNVLLSGEYYSRDPLDIGERDYSSGTTLLTSPTYLLPDRSRTSLVLNLRQDLADRLDLSVSALFSDENVRSSSGYTAEFTGDTVVLSSSRNKGRQWTAFAGLGYEAFGDWHLELGSAFSRVDPTAQLMQTDPDSGVTLLQIEDLRNIFDQRSFDLKGSGKLLEAPAGPVRLAVGGSYREDELRSSSTFVLPDLGFSGVQRTSREVTSAFAELYIPLASRRRLDLSLAGRYDDYTDIGSTTNPRIGLVWAPFGDLDVRASYSTSFRSPAAVESRKQDDNTIVVSRLFVAPSGAGPRVPILLILGKSAQLGPEQSKNLTLGFDYRPAALEGLDLSFNYYKIDYTDRISSPPFALDALTRRDDFGALISEFADDAEARAFVAAQRAQGATFLDLARTGGGNGVRFLFDVRQQNAAQTNISGFDVTARYAFRVGGSDFDLGLNASRIRHILTALGPDTTTFDALNTLRNPIDWRARSMGTWSVGNLSTTLAVNYSNSYINETGLVDVAVDSWTTADLTLIYRFGGVRLSLSAMNVFDTAPPKVEDPFLSIGYDVTNANPLGRLLAIQGTLEW